MISRYSPEQLERIPADEPVFLLRSCDKAAPEAVRYWAMIVENMGGDPDIVSSARAHAELMEKYPGEKKIPDLERS